MTEKSPLIPAGLTMAGSEDGLVCGPDGCAIVPASQNSDSVNSDSVNSDTVNADSVNADSE